MCNRAENAKPPPTMAVEEHDDRTKKGRLVHMSNLSRHIPRRYHGSPTTAKMIGSRKWEKFDGYWGG
ncbi:hypothetical protein TNCV_2104471 [Trichonephila clavipes]|nr:hypothetical protein TNCV_2104471 [Trichonephila clavipes]